MLITLTTCMGRGERGERGKGGCESKTRLATSFTYFLTSLMGEKFAKNEHTLVSGIVVFMSETCWSWHTINNS